jgi:ubiquitin-like 1-activating enzyme E1 A
VESLNPQVTVQAISISSLSGQEDLDTIVQTVDLVCVTDAKRDDLVSRLNFFSS